MVFGKLCQYEIAFSYVVSIAEVSTSFFQIFCCFCTHQPCNSHEILILFHLCSSCFLIGILAASNMSSELKLCLGSCCGICVRIYMEHFNSEDVRVKMMIEKLFLGENIVGEHSWGGKFSVSMDCWSMSPIMAILFRISTSSVKLFLCGEFLTWNLDFCHTLNPFEKWHLIGQVTKKTDKRMNQCLDFNFDELILCIYEVFIGLINHHLVVTNFSHWRLWMFFVLIIL